MRRLLASAAAVSLVALSGPALAAVKPVPKHGACKAPAGAFVLKPGASVQPPVTTPVGALGSTAEPIGDFYVDLSGKPDTTKGTLELVMEWTTASTGATDYDLVVNGTNDLSTDIPEFRAERASHCRKITVAVEVFTGVPVDEITLTAKAR
jgi:hypothetical protein